MKDRLLVFAALFAAVLPLSAQENDTGTKEIRAAGDRYAQAFQAGKAEDVAALFAPTGELIDEDGNLYRGTKEVTELFASFFQRFPAAKLQLEPESIRLLGPALAIEDGSRLIQTKAGEAKAQLRYTSVWNKVEGKWLLASVREFTADEPPTPHERLLPLSWLIGEWVNEGSDGLAKLRYKWSEDKNYILCDFDITIEGRPDRKGSQRIGWDPAAGRVRSWLFDSDGGFSEGKWSAVDDEWVVKSETVNADGGTGSATLTLKPTEKNRFTMKGTDRIINEMRAPDFELNVVRRPPTAEK